MYRKDSKVSKHLPLNMLVSRGSINPLKNLHIYMCIWVSSTEKTCGFFFRPLSHFFRVYNSIFLLNSYNSIVVKKMTDSGKREKERGCQPRLCNG